jgi:hypothetical protein
MSILMMELLLYMYTKLNPSKKYFAHTRRRQSPLALSTLILARSPVVGFRFSIEINFRG